MPRGLWAFCLILFFAQHAFSQVERVWISHKSSDADKIVLNWTTPTPSRSVVRYGANAKLEKTAELSGSRTLHHLELPATERAADLHYSVGEAEHATPTAIVPGWKGTEFKVAIVANWHSKADLTALIQDQPQLLTTGGDNIPSLWQTCGEGTVDCYAPYAKLIDNYQSLFRTTPFLPTLGNHDREIRRRGDKPPAKAVYDIEATAFRTFFELPGDEWKWYLDIPGFDLRLIALDLNHLSDHGNTWQTCHDFDPESAQFRWYRESLERRQRGFVVTLYNERNSAVRSLAKGAWQQLFRQTDLCVSGFGYFAERAEAEGLTYINTSLGGTGAKYADSKSKFFVSEDNYTLLTVNKTTKTMAVELKNLQGKVLDRTELKMKQTP